MADERKYKLKIQHFVPILLHIDFLAKVNIIEASCFTVCGKETLFTKPPAETGGLPFESEDYIIDAAIYQFW